MEIGGPGVEGQADDALLDIDEALGVEHLHGGGLEGDGFAAARGGVLEVVVPAEERGVFARVGGVVAAGAEVDFHVFEVAVFGLEVSGGLGFLVRSRVGEKGGEEGEWDALVDLVVHFRPVRDPAAGHAQVDEVPGVFA